MALRRRAIAPVPGSTNIALSAEGDCSVVGSTNMTLLAEDQEKLEREVDQ